MFDIIAITENFTRQIRIRDDKKHYCNYTKSEGKSTGSVETSTNRWISLVGVCVAIRFLYFRLSTPHSVITIAAAAVQIGEFCGDLFLIGTVVVLRNMTNSMQTKL